MKTRASVLRAFGLTNHGSEDYGYFYKVPLAERKAQESRSHKQDKETWKEFLKRRRERLKTLG